MIAEAKEQGIDLNNQESEESKALVKILEEEPILNHLPDGFGKTWELYQLRKTYEEVPKLQARIKELGRSGQAYQVPVYRVQDQASRP